MEHKRKAVIHHLKRQGIIVRELVFIEGGAAGNYECAPDGRCPCMPARRSPYRLRASRPPDSDYIPPTKNCHQKSDICAMNLLTGEAEFVKAGAAASYIKRGNWVDEVAADTLPLGLK